MSFVNSTSFFFSCFCFNYFAYLACCLGATTMDVFFFSTLPSFVSCCTLPVRGAVCSPPNCSTRTPTDTLMTTALCASPAARMRRGGDERRAEGAVTCGRATRATGAEHIFLPSCFVFAVRAGRHPQRHTHSHTLPPCF
ncbi:ATPase, putative [Trypanosoma cruzi]|uniref:ATPase, putative n=1 Tax=Trypanosoma cruzi (strain CL Brener) TaxID=353153 RepID=Q4CQ86_TRYCC|nr:ATPase, putative [Trypanosoma cruzi]EAN82437.1 ATPase, putative [Trypanosoma cruzi]|eukprot:XP_804288.1 ATPase [Trypanosoma cruzi strain CL Brener]